MDVLFWAKVDKSGECWLWTGSRFKNGYGKLTRQGKSLYAHRHSYVLEYGTPKAPMVLHHCDARLCVRPEHLFVGTAADNSADMVAKGRCKPGAKFTNQAGESNYQAKLKAIDVLAASELRKLGWTYKQLGHHFSVSTSAIHRALTHSYANYFIASKPT